MHDQARESDCKSLGADAASSLKGHIVLRSAQIWPTQPTARPGTPHASSAKKILRAGLPGNPANCHSSYPMGQQISVKPGKFAGMSQSRTCTRAWGVSIHKRLVGHVLLEMPEGMAGKQQKIGRACIV
eukprot:467428-Pelagomonas_calceolata.AAC.2